MLREHDDFFTKEAEMKTLFILALFMVSMATVFFGCTEDPDKMLKITNALYLDIKTVVTDPEIKPMIPDKTVERLVVVEQVYLKAASALKSNKSDAQRPLATIVGCADEILDIIGTLVLDGSYDRQLAAIRLSVKILKNHLQLE